MKKFLLSSSFLLMLVIAMQSCIKEVHQSEAIKEITIDTTIQVNSDYVLNLAPFGKDDDVATILQKGNNFSISQLENVNDMFTSVYHYVPASKATGTDQVVLSISQNPLIHNACSKDSTIIYINFIIK